MPTIRSFKELRVWQRAMDLAMRIYERSKSFPAEERYSLTDQVRKSSRSVPSNIAEAWRKRRYPAAFVSKLNDAEGEAAETQTWVEIARRCGLLCSREAVELDRGYEDVLGQLVAMASRPDQWAIREPARADAVSPRLRVPVSPYRVAPAHVAK